MPSTRLFIVLLAGLGASFPLAAAAGGDPENEASRLFQRRFENGEIKGTGHLFRITVDCDRERLKALRDTLGKNEIHVVEYRFTFVQNTKHKDKARIDGSGLDKAVAQCIIDRYYKEVTFVPHPLVPEEIPDPVRFPAVIAAGRQPIVPATPIGFVGPE